MVLRALPHLWAAVIVGLMLLPGSAIAVEPPFFADKWAHLGVFLIWTVLWRATTPRAPRWLVAVAVVALAVGSELCHLLLPALHRSAEWLDLAADLIGAGLGWHLANRLMAPRPTEYVSKSIDYRS